MSATAAEQTAKARYFSIRLLTGLAQLKRRRHVVHDKLKDYFSNHFDTDADTDAGTDGKGDKTSTDHSANTLRCGGVAPKTAPYQATSAPRFMNSY